MGGGGGGVAFRCGGVIVAEFSWAGIYFFPSLPCGV